MNVHTLHLLCLAVLAWCSGHPAEVTLATGAVVSCFYKRLSKYPRWRAFFDLLAHMGFNLPGVTNALARLVSGKAAITGAALILAVATTHCGSALTKQDTSDLAVYAAAQDVCIAATPHDKAAIDACRAKVKADWCAREAARFDAGVCQ